MEIAEMEKLLESKKDVREKLDKEIRELKIKLDIKKYPDRICSKCGDGFMYDDGFSFADVIICSNCNKHVRSGYTIHKNTIQTMRFILDMDIKRLGVLRFSRLVRSELDYILSGYLAEKIGKTLKTRNFINQIKDEK